MTCSRSVRSRLADAIARSSWLYAAARGHFTLAASPHPCFRCCQNVGAGARASTSGAARCRDCEAHRQIQHGRKLGCFSCRHAALRRDCPFLFHWLSVDRWRPLRRAAGCSRTLPGGGVRRRARGGWHVIAKYKDGNSGHDDPDDKSRQEPSAAVSVPERSLSVGVQTWIGLLRLSVGRLAVDHSFPLPVVGPTRL
jgi:hypothetical protein